MFDRVDEYRWLLTYYNCSFCSWIIWLCITWTKLCRISSISAVGNGGVTTLFYIFFKETCCGVFTCDNELVLLSTRVGQRTLFLSFSYLKCLDISEVSHKWIRQGNLFPKRCWLRMNNFHRDGFGGWGGNTLTLKLVREQIVRCIELEKLCTLHCIGICSLEAPKGVVVDWWRVHFRWLSSKFFALSTVTNHWRVTEEGGSKVEKSPINLAFVRSRVQTTNRLKP